MARFRFPSQGNGTTKDANGRVLEGVTVSVFLAGTTTPASIYAASSGGTAVNSVLSDSYGAFVFYVDMADYTYPQAFDIVYSKSSNGINWTTTTVYNVQILGPSTSNIVVNGGTSTANNITSFADTSGLNIEDSGIAKTDVSSAISLKHSQQHVITSTSDHTSTATSGRMLKADANGLPVDATNTDTDVASAVSLKHTQNTDTGTSSTTFRVGAGADDDIYFYAQNADANKPYLHYNKTSNKWFFSNDGLAETEMTGPGSAVYASAAEDLASVEALKSTSPLTNPQNIKNLKIVVNAAVNKLDIKTQSGNAIPDASNAITIAIPDGSGNTFERILAAYLSGTFQFILADATSYWGVASHATDKIKLHPYAIYDANGGIVLALSRYAGFHQVPTTTDTSSDDYFLLEAGSTYTRAATDHCVCLGEVWANYNTANTPDWTFLDAATAVEFSPQVVWNPKSDYGFHDGLASNITSNVDIADQTLLGSRLIKQSGEYFINADIAALTDAGNTYLGFIGSLRIGATYATSSLIQTMNAATNNVIAWNPIVKVPAGIRKYLNAGDKLWLGGALYAGSGNRIVSAGATHITIQRVD